tara:strand:+ start:392 stop:880 length:489 start_codon:yes stop_codon:yes gene_type:complete
MGDIYTTIHPETGELTKETESVNSWKWSNEKIGTEIGGFDHRSHQQRALINTYSLPSDTTLHVVEIIATLKELCEKADERTRQHGVMNQEYLDALEAASYKEKNLQKTQRGIKKKLKHFLKDIEKYLTHDPECVVSRLNMVGRVKIKSRCNCGLSETLKSMK